MTETLSKNDLKIENLNKATSKEELQFLISTFPQKKISGPDGFTHSLMVIKDLQKK